MGYAKELGKYIQVDIYGRCGTKICTRRNENKCFEILKKEYKFHLAFENSNCRDYITEKFFINGLKYNVIPIVMGAHPDDYREVAPENSYIHYEDFKSPKELADYLHKLDKNDTLYNEYFKWKGTGEFIDTKFWCRVCAMLHAADYYKPTWYENIWEWWGGKGQCIGKDRWT
ncbi:glycoprotein 3-alpha-L-fucosyltransferase A-like [Octopus vulgaris]|uniref:Fucosyltransferase n=1 Tax=Octopus vulgaris TaxID=6645 RepID=A0AA36BYU3_OCTVU|nr:glycoprotein 3-alpha-L-fucosyltransferase A-like [Octopus vulgaris]